MGTGAGQLLCVFSAPDSSSQGERDQGSLCRNKTDDTLVLLLPGCPREPVGRAFCNRRLPALTREAAFPL